MGWIFTGFGFRDEMEEGEFDSTGQFHFKKREDTDHWLESVDWKKVRKDEKKDEAMEQGADMPEVPAVKTIKTLKKGGGEGGDASEETEAAAAGSSAQPSGRGGSR